VTVAAEFGGALDLLLPMSFGPVPSLSHHNPASQGVARVVGGGSDGSDGSGGNDGNDGNDGSDGSDGSGGN
jgi:hypothetical protein